MPRQPATHNKGFTLIELVTVIIVLGVVSVGVSGFIRTGIQIYADTTERDQLLSDSRFVVERINRELRGAIPNSVRVAVNNSGSRQTQCIEFVPSEWASFYTNLSVSPDVTTNATLVEFANNPVGFTLQAGDFAIVYPVNNDDVYDLANGKRKTITSCIDDGVDTSCNSTPADSTGGTAVLTVDSAFDDHSPASRLYIARESVSYCVVRNGNIGDIYRTVRSINTQPINTVDRTSVLMAENLTNNLSLVSEVPFTIYEASLTRNSLVQILLTFERNEEVINYNNEVHLPNVP